MKHRNLRTLGRRSFLYGLGGTLVSLPFLHSLGAGDAQAAPAMHPKRLVVVHHGQGTLLDQWRPGSLGADFAMSPLLGPLARHKDKMLVVSGVHNRARRSQRSGNGHNPAGRSIMSATPFKESFDASGALLPGDEHQGNGDSYGPSFDQVIAERLMQPNQRRSLHLGIGRSGAGENACWFRGAPGQTERVSNEGDPTRVFEDLFQGLMYPGDNMTPPTRAERFRARSSSVLDAVAKSYTDLERRVPVEDREILASHAAKIRDIESNLNIQVEITNACARPTLDLPQGYTHSEDAWQEITSRNQIDLLTMALACDISRVATVQFTQYHGPRFSHIDGYQVPVSGYTGWHDMVHKQGDAASRNGLFDGVHWYAEQVAYLLDRLSGTQEGDGTLLDNTLVLWVSEFGNGGSHSTQDIPVVLMGDLGGTVQTGSHIDVGGRTTNDLFLALLKLYGGSDESFGLARGHDGEVLVQGPLEVAT